MLRRHRIVLVYTSTFFAHRRSSVLKALFNIEEETQLKTKTTNIQNKHFIFTVIYYSFFSSK